VGHPALISGSNYIQKFEWTELNNYKTIHSPLWQPCNNVHSIKWVKNPKDLSALKLIYFISWRQLYSCGTAGQSFIWISWGPFQSTYFVLAWDIRKRHFTRKSVHKTQHLLQH